MNSKLLESWSEGIFRSIVAIGRPGKPLFIYIDSEILGEIANLNPKDAQKAFAKSFLTHYKRGLGDSPFENAVLEALKWPKTPGFKSATKPQILPLLALCVIAVTDKSSSPRQGVYSLLNELLGENEEQGKPKGYEFMPEIWEIWNKWLKNSGSKYGKPTARVIDQYALQGYARSQGFIRRRERVYITDFFSDSGILPGTEMQKEYLLSLFETWLRGQGRKELLLYKKIFENSEVITREIFSEILVNELENWDGLTQTESGGDSLVGYLARDSFSSNWEVICSVQKKMLGIKIDLGDGPATIDESWPLIYISQIESKKISEVLKRGITYKLNESLSLKAGGRNFYLFSNGKYGFSGYVEERNPKLFTKYTLLVEATLLEEMKISLDAYNSTYTEPALDTETGYYEIQDLVFATRRISNDSKIKFKFPIDPPPKITLVGGLQFGKNQYEKNYPPKLHLPFDNRYELLIDGERVGFSEDQDYIELSKLNLKIGSHEVQFGETSIVFFLVESKRIEPASMSKGIPLVNISGSIKLGTLKSNKESEAPCARGAFFPKTSVPLQSGYLKIPYEYTYVFLLQDNEKILRQINVERGARFTRSKWRGILNVPESKLDLELLSQVFSGEGYLIFKQSSARKCSIFRVQGKKDDKSAAPRYISNSANGAIESILLSDWDLHQNEGAIDEQTVRAKLQKIRLTAPMTQMISTSEIFRKFKEIDDASVEFGPLDFLLEWISEQDDSSVSFEEFEIAWQTLEMAGYQDNWRQTASYLEQLGHVEVDNGLKKILVHPSVANVLQGEGDYAVLSGSRPYKLQEILAGTAPELLKNSKDFESIIEYKLRHQPKDAREVDAPNTGPAIALIKSSDFFGEKTQSALNSIGIEVCYNTGTRYLVFSPTVLEVAYIGQEYDLSLSNKFEKFGGFQSLDNGFREIWRSINSDQDAGIYRYIRENSYKTLAVRFEIGEPLYELDTRWARYLYLSHYKRLRPSGYGAAQQLHNTLPWLTEIREDKLLFVPSCIRLPGVVSQGLILQSGIPLETYESGDLYQNIGQGEVAELARILGFDLIKSETGHDLIQRGFASDLNLRYGIYL